jgi:hypothetical protein
MNHIAFTQVVATAVYLVALQHPCRLHADDGAARLAQQAAREFDALAPSLRQATGLLIEKYEGRAADENAWPEIEWSRDYRKVRAFARPDGKRVSIPTEFTYKIAIRQKTFRYRFDRIQNILRTGERNRPFSGVVDFEVMTTTRTASAQLSEPNDRIPKQYRRVDIPPQEAVGLPTEIPFVVTGGGTFENYPVLPFQACFDPNSDIAPPIIVNAKKQLIDQCRRKQPQQDRSIVRVKFYYLLNDHKWRAEHDTEG